MLGLYIFAFVIGLYKISGDYYMKKTYDSFSNNDWKSMEKNAFKTINTFYRLDPTVIPAKWYQALALSMQGRYKESLPLYEEALKENPYQYEVLNNLASNYEILGNHTKAIALYKKALAIAPLFEESSLNLASVYYNQNNIDSALFFTLQVSIDSVRKNHLLKLINQKTIK